MFLHNSDQRRTFEGRNTARRQTIARRTLSAHCVAFFEDERVSFETFDPEQY